LLLADQFEELFTQTPLETADRLRELLEPLRTDPDISRLIDNLRAQGFLSDPSPKQIELAHETLLNH
jgi:hypothetical protein